jgi:hypothetical protein
VSVDRVYVTLEREEDDYPPWDEEWLWAEQVAESAFRLTTSPTFAKGLSLFDVVHAVLYDGRWFIDSVIESSGHSTLRVVLFDDKWHERLHEMGAQFGCAVEHTEIPGYFAIDVPPDGEYDGLLDALRKGAAAGAWDFDEAAIAVAHQSPPS